MKLTSYHANGRDAWGVVVGDRIVDASSRYPSLRAALAADGLASVAAFAAQRKPDVALAEVTLLPVIPDPGKIVCIGLNYVEHVHEVGREVGEKPTLFLRVAESQVGHQQDLVLPPESSHFDYEGEIAVIIGRGGRRIREADAAAHVAGYACYNDGSIRDWQRHSPQWTAGKNFWRTGGFGPWMVTADEIPFGTQMTLVTRLNGKEMQRATTDMMIHSIARQIAYTSSFIPLAPGDVIVSGTPGGVGARRDPPVFMKHGDTVEVEVDKVGILVNRVVAERG